MRNRIIVSIVALAGVVSLSSAAPAQAQGQEVIPSVPPPAGWKSCPRCQNQKDRTDANIKYKVEGHTFNPRDLSGVWGFQGVGGTFMKPPPLTPWGKQQQ